MYESEVCGTENQFICLILQLLWNNLNMKKQKSPRKPSKQIFSKKLGLPPGSLVHVGKIKVEKTKVELVEYNEDGISTVEVVSLDDLEKLQSSTKKIWLKVIGLHDVSLIEKIGKIFELDSLLLEDVLNTSQRPKIEIYDNSLFLTLRTLGYINDNQIVSDQVSFVMRKNLLISFHESELPLFDLVIERLKSAASRFFQNGIDYLLYALIDVVVDNYYLVIEQIAEKLDRLEDELFEESNTETWDNIQILRKDLLFIKKVVFPLRDVINSLAKRDTKLIHERNIKYFIDISDHIMQVYETIETYRDLNSGLKDMYLSNLSNKMNQIMKVLTIISTIFIPITFIAGVYGMNFENVPEYGWKYGYYIVWGVFVLIVVGMLIFFRKKKWL